MKAGDVMARAAWNLASAIADTLIARDLVEDVRLREKLGLLSRDLDRIGKRIDSIVYVHGPALNGTAEPEGQAVPPAGQVEQDRAA